MNVSVPPAIAEMGLPLQEFFSAMVHKLAVNSHKDAIREDDIDGLLQKMQDEIEEFREQRVLDESDPAILSELADIGNFCFLLYAFVRAKGVKDAKEQFIDEYFEVDIYRGKILCKKTRSGSPYRVGDEVLGSGKPVRIRTQHALSGTTISVLRRDIVWWKANGEWPKYPVRHRAFSGTNPDRISNLRLETPKGDRKFPFVSQYCPRGKEHVKNFGKWVYQRRHAFRLVRVGYWDTPEEAAREGLKAWKRRTKETMGV